jgi:hypothetical protein
MMEYIKQLIALYKCKRHTIKYNHNHCIRTEETNIIRNIWFIEIVLWFKKYKTISCLTCGKEFYNDGDR